MLQEIAEEHGGREFQWKKSLEDRDVLWKARHNAYYATNALQPGSKVWTTDVCVPISCLAECIIETKKDLEKISLMTTIVGHVGDGNFHVLCVLDPDKPGDLDEVGRFSEMLVKRALSLGGTCSGEHGIGYGKMKYLEQEHGAAVEVMRAIKLALDPDNRMNPGKIVVPR